MMGPPLAVKRARGEALAVAVAVKRASRAPLAVKRASRAPLAVKRASRAPLAVKRASRAPAAVGRACRAAPVLALAALAALALGGCETTAEESAKLEKKAKREQAEHPITTAKGLSIVHPSAKVRVLEVTVLHSAEGAAAAVTVTNTSTRPLREVPIAITVKSASGQTLYQNNAPGLEAALTRIAALPAHGTLTWVDDQVPATGGPVQVNAIVGEASPADGSSVGAPPPRMAVSGVHLIEAATGEAGGTVRNASSTAQQRLVVFVIARRGGRVVAAGRALLPSVGAGASASFQTFLIGSPAGATLQASAPATILG